MGKIAALSTSVAALTQSRDSYKKIAEKLMDEKELEREKLKQKIEENPMPKEVEEVQNEILKDYADDFSNYSSF